MEALASLPPRWQSVLWRTEVEGDRPREVADDLRMSPNSVAALALRARAGLRTAYLRSQLPSQSADLPELCGSLRHTMPDYLRGKLKTGARMQLRLHVEECESCATVLAELQQVSERIRGLALPALLLALAGQSASTLGGWAKSPQGIGTGVAAGAVGATVALVIVLGQDEPSPLVEIVDVTADAAGTDRTYEVRVQPMDAPAVEVEFTLPPTSTYLGSFDETPVCFGDGTRLTCQVGLVADEGATWRFEVEGPAEQPPEVTRVDPLGDPSP